MLKTIVGDKALMLVDDMIAETTVSFLWHRCY